MRGYFLTFLTTKETDIYGEYMALVITNVGGICMALMTLAIINVEG